MSRAVLESTRLVYSTIEDESSAAKGSSVVKLSLRVVGGLALLAGILGFIQLSSGSKGILSLKSMQKESGLLLLLVWSRFKIS